MEGVTALLFLKTDARSAMDEKLQAKGRTRFRERSETDEWSKESPLSTLPVTVIKYVKYSVALKKDLVWFTASEVSVHSPGPCCFDPFVAQNMMSRARGSETCLPQVSQEAKEDTKRGSPSGSQPFPAT